VHLRRNIDSVTDDIRLREYDHRDLNAMVALDVACFAPTFRFSKASMQQFAEAENAWSQVAVASEGLAGFCIVHREQIPGGTIGYLVTIDVAAGHRRKGLGEQMLLDGESWLRSYGAVAMFLHVYVKNSGAIRFYENAGYERDSEKRGFYGPGKDAAMFWKRLDR
jgi:ribosomal-protein-alanine N-acetyltransferase